MLYKRIALYLFLFCYTLVLRAQTPGKYHNDYTRISKGDTTGLYDFYFIQNKNSKDFYHHLLRGDYLFFVRENATDAFTEYQSALERAIDQKADSLKALATFRMGGIYFFTDNYPEALNLFNKSSIIIGKPKNNWQARIYIQKGMIKSALGNPKQSLDDYLIAIEFFHARKDSLRIAATQNNIALTYMESGDFNKARLYMDSCLRFRIIFNDEGGLGQSYNNIGTIFYRSNQFDSALFYYQKGLYYRERLKILAGWIESLINIGKTYFALGNTNKALKWVQDAYNRAEADNHTELMRRSAEQLKDYYKKVGDFKNALFYQEKYFIFQDSLYGFDKRMAVESSTLRNSLERKMYTDSLQAAQKLSSEKTLAEEKEKRNKYVLYFIGVVLLIMVVFIIHLIITNQKRKKSNRIITEQKQHLAEKQKEIIDSINYAQRLQQAILTPEETIKKYLPNSFLFYQPKDIVAGDFYFFEVTDTHIFYAAADCTGHGVPGAMVSIVCANALTRCVKEFGLTDPGKILDKSRELVVETFEKSGSDVKDGMDISLLSVAYRIESRESRIETSSNDGSSLSLSVLALQWAGANNPLWYIENSDLKEIKANKQAIGKTEKPKPFITHSLPLSLSSIILFTDGFADQFGGEKGKKFKYTNLQKLILENASQDSLTQVKNLRDNFNNWKGELEQVDDVCVIGINMN